MGLSKAVSVVCSTYTTTWLKFSSKSSSCRELSPSSSFPSCLPAPLTPVPALTSFFSSCGSMPAWQPFHSSFVSLHAFYTIFCQGTVSTAVCLCCLTPSSSSFHTCDPKLPENILIPLHTFFLLFPLLRFHGLVPAVSLIPAITHSETQAKSDKP